MPHPLTNEYLSPGKNIWILIQVVQNSAQPEQPPIEGDARRDIAVFI